MVGPWQYPLLTLCCAAVLLSAAPTLALETGELKELEGLLRDLGFDPGPVDGVVDADTTEAIRRYKEFALLPGDPEPTEALLDELRGVAAAFAALNADKAKGKADPDPLPDPLPAPLPDPLPDLGAGPEQAPVPEPVAEKVVVPPPPAPPKLKPPKPGAEPDSGPDSGPDVGPAVEAVPEPAEQVATLSPAEETSAEAEPLDETQDAIGAMLDEELASFQKDLDSGAVTRAELAKRFNAEGRKLLQAAQYEDAIRKFSVAIFLDSTFAGAYSNRGTAYQRSEQPDLAKADFDKAREMGFGGVRLGDSQNPLK